MARCPAASRAASLLVSSALALLLSGCSDRGSWESRDLRLGNASGSHDQKAETIDDGPDPIEDVDVGGKRVRLFNATEYQEQDESEFNVGDPISLFFIGASSTVWMTWIEQLHYYILRLGYHMPIIDARYKYSYTARSVQSCDDSDFFEKLLTPRFGRIGWSSWDFAYEGWEGCKDGFRNHSGMLIKCQHGPGCHFSKNATLVSKVAKDAAKSDITLLSTWYNDDQHEWSKFKCFNGTHLKQSDSAALSIDSLLRTTREIHKANRKTWVIIMGKYPQSYKHRTNQWFKDLNHKVAEELEKEPRTLFVDYYMPGDEVTEMYQKAHAGHPNCRGSKLMAHAVLKRLWDAKLLGRSLRLIDPDWKKLTNEGCPRLVGAECHSAPLCWVDPQDESSCKPYGPGSSRAHNVNAVELPS